MKKYLAVSIATLLLFAGFLSAGFIFRGKEFSRFPKKGLYFAETDSYYSYSEQSGNPLVTLVCFEVKGEESLLRYDDFSFLAGSREYLPLDASVVPVFTDEYLTRYTVQAVLDIMAFPVGETVTLDTLRLKKGDKTTDHDIGNLRVARFPGSASEGIGVTGYTQGAGQFLSYTVNVSNNGAETVVLEDLILEIGSSFSTKATDFSGKQTSLNGYRLDPGTAVTVTALFEGTDQKEVVFNFLKPALVYTVSGEERILPVGGISDYVTPLDRDGIIAYLNGRTS